MAADLAGRGPTSGFGLISRPRRARLAVPADPSGPLVPHLPEIAHVLDHELAVLAPPIGDGAVFGNPRLAVTDDHDRPVSNQGIVAAEQFLAPPLGRPEGIRAVAARLHRRQPTGNATGRGSEGQDG